MIVWLLFFTLCVYQVCDIWQTWWLVKLGGEEANPLIVFGIQDGGIMFPVYLKTLWSLVLLLGLLIHRRKSKEAKKIHVL